MSSTGNPSNPMKPSDPSRIRTEGMRYSQSDELIQSAEVVPPCQATIQNGALVLSFGKEHFLIHSPEMAEKIGRAAMEFAGLKLTG